MTDQLHSCSYYCDRPECIRQQRDELRARVFGVTESQLLSVCKTAAGVGEASTLKVFSLPEIAGALRQLGIEVQA